MAADVRIGTLRNRVVIEVGGLRLTLKPKPARLIVANPRLAKLIGTEEWAADALRDAVTMAAATIA
jgi:hypothetical protein